MQKGRLSEAQHAVIGITKWGYGTKKNENSVNHEEIMAAFNIEHKVIIYCFDFQYNNFNFLIGKLIIPFIETVMNFFSFL